MTSRSLVPGLIVAGALGLGGYGLYALGKRQGEAAPAVPTWAVAADGADRSTGRTVLYWHDPMVPGRRFDKPGKSPFMDMQLVPVYADAGGDAGSVAVSPRLQQSLGVRTAEVVAGTLAAGVEAAGSIAFNERDQAVVQARAAGYVEKLHVRAMLDAVRKGQPLADLFVPEWIAAQEEFLSVRRMQGTDLAPLVDGARQRMRLAGMGDAQIRRVEHTGKAEPRVTLLAPIDGVLVELAAREGMTVMSGTTLFRVSGLATVWAHADVPESQSALLRPGMPVEARSPALPGTAFKGRVQALLPDVNQATRTVRARIELANPQRRLVPGMFVTVALGTAAATGLTVPTEAVIQTGRRTLVMVAEGDGRFRPVDVETGRESDGRTEVRRGLHAGQRVVVSGQFLLDSEASLRAATGRMEDPAAAAGAAAAGEYSSQARIEAVGKDAVTLSHQPIPALQWGAMTMDFRAPPGGLPAGLAPGQSVGFAFSMGPDGTPVLTRIGPAAPGDAAAPASGAMGAMPMVPTGKTP